jgi:DEAD/DEAH box helicase domain-containing protein
VVRNPDYFFGSSPEHALVNPDNLHILLEHVKCAAFELPFRSTEAFGSLNVQEILAVLAEEQFVQFTDGQWHWTQDSYPADAVSLRSVTSDNFVVIDTTDEAERVIGETDFTAGPPTLHEKAIYIVEGQLFQVDRFDFDGRKAYVTRVECDYYTDAITYTKVTVLETFTALGAERLALDHSGAIPDAEKTGLETPSAQPSAELRAASAEPLAFHGEVHVVSRVVGFKKIKFYTNENVGSGELDLPEQQMHTTSYWLTIPRELMAQLKYPAADRRDGVVGLSFAMRNVAPLLLMCDGHDLGLSVDGVAIEGASRLGGVSSRGAAVDPSVQPTIFIYDNYPGGIGFSEPLFSMHELLLARTRELIDGCPCESGCPSCVGPEGATGPQAKRVASELLALLAARSADREARAQLTGSAQIEESSETFAQQISGAVQQERIAQ